MVGFIRQHRILVAVLFAVFSLFVFHGLSHSHDTHDGNTVKCEFCKTGEIALSFYPVLLASAFCLIGYLSTTDSFFRSYDLYLRTVPRAPPLFI